MSRHQLSRRLRARLRGERGFTILESVIALFVIFACLTALMYTATSGFRYIALGRERQSATGAATRIMEQIQALTSDTITRGMKTSDLAGDTRIKTPAQCGDGAYHFIDCAGEKIVHDATATNATPLVPHTGTLLAPEYPTDYTWATYITNSNPANDPYRITVIVSWTGGGVSGAAKFLQLQTLWSSPKGCAASAVIHPFAGPCQPYFSGSATTPQGTIVISGTVNGTAVSSATLFGPQSDTRASAEQVSQMLVTIGQSGVSTPSASRGLANTSIAADGNPSTASTQYAPSSGVPPATFTPSYGTAIAVTGSPVAMSLSGGSSGDSGSATAADQANAASQCPSVASPWPSFQSDDFPCAWGQAVRGATVSGTINTTSLLGGTSASAGSMTLAQLGGTTTLNTWADRAVPSGTTGTLTMTARRAVGVVELFGVPAKFLASATATDTNTVATSTTLSALQTCTGGNYLFRATTGTATAAATAGVSASNPSAAWSGASAKLYDGYTGDGSAACDSYADAQLNGTSAQQPIFPGSTTTPTAITLQRAVRVSGSNWSCITYKVSLPAGASSPLFGGATTTKVPSAGTTLTDTTATINPIIQGDFRIQLLYETSQNSGCTAAAPVISTIVDVTATVSVGGATARAQYVAPPTGG